MFIILNLINMKTTRTIYLLVFSLLLTQVVLSQKETKKRDTIIKKGNSQMKYEYIKPKEISKEKKNEYTGKYKFSTNEKLILEVKINGDAMVIIIPEGEKNDKGEETLRQYTLVPQFEDKFYWKGDSFVKIHFTRSKKTNKIVSVLFNASRDKKQKVIRAYKL